jgi:hypothetical protein
MLGKMAKRTELHNSKVCPRCEEVESAALVRKLHDIAWDLWEHRNGILHDKETGFAARHKSCFVETRNLPDQDNQAVTHP